MSIIRPKLAPALLALLVTACGSSTEPEMTFVSLSGTVFFDGTPSEGWGVTLVEFERVPAEGSGWGNLLGWGGGGYADVIVEELLTSVTGPDGGFVVEWVVESATCSAPGLGLEVESADSTQVHWGLAVDVDRDWPYYGIPCGEGTKYDFHITGLAGG